MRYIISLLLASLVVVSVRAETPSPPALGANGYLLIDHDSGAVLAAANADARLEPASLTKIMTAYVVFNELAAGNIALDDQVLISEKAWRTGGSKMFIEVGNQIAVEDLLKGMIIQSGNDASVALAEHVAGSEARFCRADEPARAAARDDADTFYQCHRLARPGALHHAQGYRAGDNGDDSRIPRILSLVLGA